MKKSENRGKLETASSMLSNGVSIDIAQKSTGLSQKQILNYHKKQNI